MVQFIKLAMDILCHIALLGLGGLTVTRTQTFSRALSKSHVFTWSFDWYAGLYVSSVIGYRVITLVLVL